MDIDATFLPVAEELISVVFPTPIVFHQHMVPTYDPTTGAVTAGNVDYNISAGVLSRSRTEEGGANETYEISIWVSHGPSGINFLPATSDSFTYDGLVWRVVKVDPAYSSKALIASKITGRAS